MQFGNPPVGSSGGQSLKLVLMWTVAVGALLGGQSVSITRAEVSPEVRQRVGDIEQTFRKASALYRRKRFKEFANLAEQARQQLAELRNMGSLDELAPRLASLERKLSAADELLRLRNLSGDGASVPGAGVAPRGQMSFIKEVLPIFAAKCANCHIRDRRGGFSMATFADLMKGSDAGIVFTAGKSEGSRLMEVLQTGDMPRGGGRLTTDEMAAIARWIDSGARFDGPDENTQLATLVKTTDEPKQPVLEAVQAEGTEAVQFVRDLAPVIVASCIECHGGMQPSARLDLSNFAALLRGGTGGPILVPGKPSESLLVRKLRGTAGDRMPLRKPPLDESVIGQFEAWIAGGAKLDWPDPAQPLEMAVRIMVATKMSHEELSAMRLDLAGRTWRLANPDVAPQVIETANLVLIGNLTPARLAELAELAKAQQAKVAELLKAKTDVPWIKGRLTLFAFGKHFDYSEFGTMVEKRDLPPNWQGHWNYSVVDAYACVVAASDDASLPLLLAEQFAGAYLETQGKLPKWFSFGSARVIAARAEPRGPDVRQWEDGVKGALVTAAGPDDLLKAGDVLTGNAAALSYGFMKGLMAKMPKYFALLDEIRQGAEFESAFRKHYGSDPATIVTAWAQGAGY